MKKRRAEKGNRIDKARETVVVMVSLKDKLKVTFMVEKLVFRIELSFWKLSPHHSLLCVSWDPTACPLWLM